jgi:hypothetical protein
MLKNYYKEIANMFGVELNQTFQIENKNGNIIYSDACQFTSKGLFINRGEGCVRTNVDELINLLNGDWKITENKAKMTIEIPQRIKDELLYMQCDYNKFITNAIEQALKHKKELDQLC